MNTIKTVSFGEGTKPPNLGPMKIHAAIKKRNDKRYTDIKLIIFHTHVSYEVAVKVYDECEEDICNSIMYIQEHKMGG